MFLGALSFYGLLYNRGWVEDRLRSWGMLLDSSCCLCRNDVETLITISLSNALNPYPFERVWCPETWFEACLGKWWTFQNGSALMSRAWASKVLVFSCSLAATVYSLWRERNPRVFQGKSTEQSQRSCSEFPRKFGTFSALGERWSHPWKKIEIFCGQWVLSEDFRASLAGF